METTEAQPTLSKADLIAQGDAICAEVNAAVGTWAQAKPKPPTRSRRPQTSTAAWSKDCRRSAPRKIAAGYEEFADAADELAQATSDAELASARGDEEALAAAQEEVSSSLAAFQEAAAVLRLRRLRRSAERPRSDGARGAAAPKKKSRLKKSAPEEVAPEEEAAPEEARPKPAAPAAARAAEPSPPAPKKAAVGAPAASAPADSGG